LCAKLDKGGDNPAAPQRQDKGVLWQIETIVKTT
jgi:hypothetical protein